MTWSTACRSQILEFPSRKAIARVQTSPNVDISRNSNGHISELRDATVTWLAQLGKLVVLHVLCMLMCPWPTEGQDQVHGAFELPTTSEAVHAGGDDRSPIAGLSGINIMTDILMYTNIQLSNMTINNERTLWKWVEVHVTSAVVRQLPDNFLDMHRHFWIVGCQ